MRPLDPRDSALFRFHDAALNAGTTLTAYARMGVHSHNDIFLPYGGILVNILSNIHEFSFDARKAIERADKEVGGIKELAQNSFLRNSGSYIPKDEDLEIDVKLTDKDFL